MVEMLWFGLIFLSFGHSTDAFLFGPTYGDVTPLQQYVATGGEISFNCTLHPNNALNLTSSDLFFQFSRYDSDGNNLPRQETPQEYYQILSPLVLQLNIKNISKESGTYICMARSNPAVVQIGLGDAIVGDPPYISESDVQIMSHNFNDMTIDWCSAPNDYTTYELYWTLPINGKVTINGTWKPCPVWVDSSKNCSCLFCGTSASGLCEGSKESEFTKYVNYSVIIKSENMYGDHSLNFFVFTDTTIVKPDPVQNFQARLGSKNGSLSWTNPGYITIYTDLTFHLQYRSQWDVDFVSSVNTSGKNTSIQLDDLLPYSNYTFVLKSKPVEGGYWSDDVLLESRTEAFPPEVAPEIPAGWFRIKMEKENKFELDIIWQPIEPRLQNGPITKYMIETNCDGSPKTSTDSNNKYSTSGIYVVKNRNCWIGLTVVNSAGKSPTWYSYIPAQFYALPQQNNSNFYAETSPGNNGIYFEWDIHGAENFTIMYCVNKIETTNLCDEEPTEIFLSNEIRNYTHISNDWSSYNFFFGVNTKEGSSGLNPVCIFQFMGLPAKPENVEAADITTDTARITWVTPACSPDKGRIISYVVGFDGSEYTVDGSVHEYQLTGLQSDKEYNVTVRGKSMAGNGEAYSKKFKTANDYLLLKIILPIVGVVLVVIVVIAIAFAPVRKCIRKWFHIDVKLPQRNTDNNQQNRIPGEIYEPEPETNEYRVIHDFSMLMATDTSEGCSGDYSQAIKSSGSGPTGVGRFQLPPSSVEAKPVEFPWVSENNSPQIPKLGAMQCDQTNEFQADDSRTDPHDGLASSIYDNCRSVNPQNLEIDSIAPSGERRNSAHPVQNNDFLSVYEELHPVALCDLAPPVVVRRPGVGSDVGPSLATLVHDSQHSGSSHSSTAEYSLAVNYGSGSPRDSSPQTRSGSDTRANDTYTPLLNGVQVEEISGGHPRETSIGGPAGQTHAIYNNDNTINSDDVTTDILNSEHGDPRTSYDPSVTGELRGESGIASGAGASSSSEDVSNSSGSSTAGYSIAINPPGYGSACSDYSNVYPAGKILGNTGTQNLDDGGGGGDDDSDDEDGYKKAQSTDEPSQLELLVPVGEPVEFDPDSGCARLNFQRPVLHESGAPVLPASQACA